MNDTGGSFDPFNHSDLQSLRTRLRGNAFVPGDSGYDEACRTKEPHFKQHPAIVVLPMITADVVAAAQFAHEHHIPIGIQGGGHGHPFDAATMDGALLINFSQMKGIQINEHMATARIESGTLWSEIVQKAHDYGLAPLNGFASTVGAVGYLLGGGWGWLVRQYGFAASSVRSMEVVTVDGRLLQANATSNSDLFWGLRGGGGNFGIITSVEFALYPIKEVFGGQVIYPIERGKEVMAAYMQWIKTLPETLTSVIRIMNYPPVPEIPPQLQGKTAIVVVGCYNGSEAEGTALFQPMRTFSTPLLDTFALIPYSQVGTISNDPVDLPPFPVYNYNRMLHDFTQKDIDALLEVASNPASGLAEVEVRHLGGIVARLPEDEMAISAREVNFLLWAVAIAPTTEQFEVGKQSITRIMQAIQPDTNVRGLLNAFAFNDLGIERTRDAYTTNNYQRLVELKNKYDPQNVLRFNNNIQPSI